MAKGKENSILYCSILNLSKFYGRHFESCSTGLGMNLVMSWFEVMIIYPFSLRMSKR